MKLKTLPVLIAAALLGLAFTPAAAAPSAPPENARAAEHARVIEFWTHQRVAKAIPRDVVLPAGTIKPTGKPVKGDSTTVLAASWTGGGLAKETTGKVFFEMADGSYVCSGSVVSDNKDDRSLVLTAGHCVVDESTGAWATNWMFIPDYDAAPAPLTDDRGFCADTERGCWAADFLVASDEFAGQGSFTALLAQHDYAFAVVSGGGHSSDAMLDAEVGAQAVQFTSGASDADTYLFGYPAAGKFRGADLVYSRGLLGFDARIDNATYRVGSSMTGGSSGGPWFQGFDATAGTGTIMSVTSYGYSGTKALFGPKLNAETQGMYDLALREALVPTNHLG